MKKAMGAVALSIFMLTSNGQAQDIRPYIGMGVGGFQIDFGLGSDTAFGGYAQGGLDIGDYIGVEFRAGGTSNAKINRVLPVAGLTQYKFGVDYFLSYLGKIRVPLTDVLQVYGVLGATTIKTKYTITQTTSTTSYATGTGLSYGLGATFQASDDFSLGAEWVRYASDANINAPSFPGLDVDGFALNIRYAF